MENQSSSENLEERAIFILEAKGRKVLEKAKKIMLQEIRLKELEAPFRYLSEKWNDTLRPALMALSCEAVGGEKKATISAATTMTLLCSSMNIYDDIIDESSFKRYRPTLAGKFGSGPAVIVGSLITAKAFDILYEVREEIPKEKYDILRKILQDFLLKMSKAETANLQLKERIDVAIKDKYQVLEMQAADIEACMRIGATIGCGTRHELDRLSTYGSYLGTLLRLREDMSVALNLTVELADKVTGGTFPYTLIWAMNKSAKAKNLISSLFTKKEIKPMYIKKIVEILFETGAINHVKAISRKLTSEATNVLQDMVKSEAVSSLKLLARSYAL